MAPTDQPISFQSHSPKRSELEAVDPVLAAALANPSPSQPLLATLRRAAEALHPPLPSAAVVAVERCEAAPAAAARLSDALRCARFARRYSNDMSRRAARRAAAVQRWKEDGGEAAAAAAAARDLAAARAMLSGLGWPAVEVESAEGSAAARQLEQRVDGLVQEALGAGEGRAMTLDAGAGRGATAGGAAHVDSPWDALLDDLAGCRRDELGMVLQASGPHKILLLYRCLAEERGSGAQGESWGTWHLCTEGQVTRPGAERAIAARGGTAPSQITCLSHLPPFQPPSAPPTHHLTPHRLSRAQRFVRSMRDDMAQRAQRAAALQAELYARAPRLLSAEEQDRFVSRLMDDARRRAQNREEIAAKAELERTRPAWEGLKGRQAKTPVPLRRGSKRR